ncbi:hypothetical protein EXU30_00520 [Shewanella maritima]|uniref:DUF1585 domain-containing protein n=1 Tax=Shewanella maritima TaxID=2520507 RepID=A0A411PCN2_9GAMM|nr:hypothetical protein [Shewanella maritima]QBF81347.1 hypothetical protein EXU30_00520 [Shewanella maritima]
MIPFKTTFKWFGKNDHKKASIFCTSLIVLSMGYSANLTAGSLEQAKRLHDRLAGVPPSEQIILDMAQLIDDNKPIEAAYMAMSSPAFYSSTLKLFATPWTNIDQDSFEPLNDYSATVIGMVRDDVDFRQILQADTVYVGDDTLNLPAYNTNNNAHYQALEDGFIDLQQHLVATSQSSVSNVPADATAGVLTTRAAAKAFFYLGTNRAMLRFTLMNHLCTDLEPLKDNSLPTDRIRQDVSRSPGGDSRLFINNCSACHTGMDPLAQAFAYYNYEFDLDNDPQGESGAVVYNRAGQIDPETGTRVQAKYHINSTTFPYGFATPDDEWQNYWRSGINQHLGWSDSLPGKGYGAKSLGQELANSEAFAQCQVKKVFKAVCLRDAESNADLAQISASTDSFKQNGFQLKRTFAEVGNYCMGE